MQGSKAHADTAGALPASALFGAPHALQAHGAPTIRHSQSALRRVLSRRSATRHASPGAAWRPRMVRREGRNIPACAHLFVGLAPTINWCQQYSTSCAHAPPLFTQDDSCRFSLPQPTQRCPRRLQAAPSHSRQLQVAPGCFRRLLAASGRHGTNSPIPALSLRTDTTAHHQRRHGLQPCTRRHSRPPCHCRTSFARACSRTPEPSPAPRRPAASPDTGREKARPLAGAGRVASGTARASALHNLAQARGQGSKVVDGPRRLFHAPSCVVGQVADLAHAAGYFLAGG